MKAVCPFESCLKRHKQKTDFCSLHWASVWTLRSSQYWYEYVFLSLSRSVSSTRTQKPKCLHAKTFPCLFSLPNFPTPKKLFFFFLAENPPGICQHQTELIALNRSRNLKVSGHDDVIIGVTEVAWESSEIRSLTSLSVQHCIQSVWSITPFAWFRQQWDWLGRKLRAWDVVSGVPILVSCVCVHEDSPKPGFGVVRGGSGGGWLRGMKRWEAGVGGEAG